MSSTPRSSLNWPAIIVFYLIACAISWPFFWWRDYTKDGYRSGFIFIIMWGPGIAALIATYVFRASHVRTITLFGSSVGRSLAIWFLPFAFATALLAITREDPTGMLKVMAQAATLGFLLTLGEELGWRGFLQDATRSLRPWKRYVFIGTVWAFWHFTNNFADRSPVQVLAKASVYVPMCIALSWLAGAMTERTRSLVVACCVHAWVNFAFEMQGLMGRTQAVILPLTLAIWWLLLRKWPAPAPR